LPPADAPRAVQAEALREWGQRLRMAIALDDAQGERIATSDNYRRRENDPAARRVTVTLEDGRQLQMLRGFRLAAMGPGGREGPGRPPPDLRPRGPEEAFAEPGMPMGGRGAERLPRRESGWWPGPWLGPGSGQALALLLLLLFLGVAAGAYPVVRRLTRRLERLQRGVEQFGAGRLDLRVDDQGKDEVAALAASFNRAAGQIETLLRSHQSLLANASHELRSPLARLKMAFAMLEGAAPAQRARLQQEIDANIAELDALVEEVLLASRLDADRRERPLEPVELLGLAAEEGARCDASVEPAPGLNRLVVQGEERLLRRALRNLLENARRYGGGEVLLALAQAGERAELSVCDRGPGVPGAMRERIFEPFFRLPGHAEQAGGVGLGLSLVKQIAERHGGAVRCQAREGGGSCFVLSLPLR
jgi:signal transduction histidine kinase